MADRYHYCPHKQKHYGGRRMALRVCAYRSRTCDRDTECWHCRVWEVAAKADVGRPASLRPSDAVPESEEYADVKGGVDNGKPRRRSRRR